MKAIRQKSAGFGAALALMASLVVGGCARPVEQVAVPVEPPVDEYEVTFLTKLGLKVISPPCSMMKFWTLVIRFALT